VTHQLRTHLGAFLWINLCILVGAATVVSGQEAAREKPLLVLNAGGHTAPVRGLAFSANGNELISAAADNTIRFWNVGAGALTGVIRLPAYSPSNGRMALSPNGQLLAINVPDARKAPGLALLALPEDGTLRRLPLAADDVWCLQFSPDGTRLASGSKDGTVCVWNVATGRCEQTLRHPGSVTGATFAPDGRRLATSCFDGAARIWTLATGAQVAVLRDAQQPGASMSGIAWSPDGKRLATGSLGQPLRIWSADGTLLSRHPALRTVRAPIFTKDSKALLVSDGTGGRLFDVDRNDDRAACPIKGEFAWQGALSPDGKLAATSGQDGEDLFLWSTADGRVIHQLAGAGRSPKGAAWSPDGKSFAWGLTAGEDFDYFKPGCLTLRHPLERAFDLTELEFAPAPGVDWRRSQATSGTLSMEVAIENNRTGGRLNVLENGRVVSTIRQNWSKIFTFLPGERVAVGGSGLSLHAARSGELLRAFEGIAVRSLAPSPDNRYLLAPRSDQSLGIWKLDRSEPLLSMFVAGDRWIIWTPEGYYAASPDGERLMGWQVNNGAERLATFYPAAQFRKALYRPDVIKRLLETGSAQKALALADAARGTKTTPTDVAKVLPPKVKLTAPDKMLSIRAPALAVRARAASVSNHPVTAMQLLLDGRPLRGQEGIFRFEAPKLGDVEASWNIVLAPGKHRLAVRAESAVSSALSEEVEVHYSDPTEQAKLPSLYAVAVGISEYPGNLKLNYAARDAQTIVKTLQDHSKGLFEKIEVKELTNEKATQREIMKGLTWLNKQATQRDIAVFFLAGHGEMTAAGNFYFLPADVDPEDIDATGVPGDQIKNLLSAMPGRVIFLLDACHAGGFEGKKRSTRSLTDDLIRDLVTDERGVIALCASTGRQFALESNEHRQGLFTLALVEGLSGKAQMIEGAVYLHHLDAYVTDRVKHLSQGRQSPTTAKPASIRSCPLTRPK
jgi:WD40 repeat protein